MMQIDFSNSVLIDPVRLGSAAVILLLAWGAGHLVGHAVARLLDTARRSDRYVRLSRRLMRWAGFALGLVLALQVLGLTAVASSLLATGGVAAIIFGFAFRDIGENLLAGVFLAFSRSFDVGDLIESGAHRGIVKSINLRDTHIRTADGQDVFIPSAEIYRSALANFTWDGLRRSTFTIGIDYADDPEVALALLRRVVAGTKGVLEAPPVITELADFADSWMVCRVHFWIDTTAGTSLSSTRTAAMIATRRALREDGFTLSSDTTTSLALPPMDVRVRRGDPTRGAQ